MKNALVVCIFLLADYGWSLQDIRSAMMAGVSLARSVTLLRHRTGPASGWCTLPGH
jgi:hypothetical protein